MCRYTSTCKFGQHNTDHYDAAFYKIRTGGSLNFSEIHETKTRARGWLAPCELCRPGRRLMRCVEGDQTLGSLTPCATSDGKIIVLPWRKHHEEIARLVGAAFAGTEKTAPERPCSWCVGPKFATIGDPARDRMVSFCMTLYLSVKGPKSTILSVRDGN